MFHCPQAEEKAEIEEAISERFQDNNCELPQDLSRFRKLSDDSLICQGDGTRDTKRRKIDVFKNDRQISQTLFVNTLCKLMRLYHLP